jgi:hypothetical protein
MHSYFIKLLLPLYAIFNLICGTVFHFATLCSAPEPPTTKELTAYFVVCALFGTPLLLCAVAWHLFKSILRKLIDTQLRWFSQERLRLSKPELHSRWHPPNVGGK